MEHQRSDDPEQGERHQPPRGVPRRGAEVHLGERLEAGPPLLLDGATGTELEARGVPSELPLWSTHALLRAPEVVSRIHADYVEAGAEILTANTFRTQRRTLDRAGIGGRAQELTRLAVSLAQRAARRREKRVWVAGSAPTLEDCYRPDLVPEPVACEREHAEHAGALAAAGADLILVETMNSVREAVAAAHAARDTRLPFFVSFACREGARLLSGEPLSEGVSAVEPYTPLVVLVNCLPPSAVPACLAILRERVRYFGVYANVGQPASDPRGGRSRNYTPAEFAAHAWNWAEAGARVVGGCCGTTPAHIRAVWERLAAA